MKIGKMKIMKENFNVSVCLIYTLAVALLLLQAPVWAQGEVVDSIAVVVDDDIILESEISYGVNTLLLESGERYPMPGKVAEMREQVINAYIMQKILLAKAAEETLTVEDRVIERELEKKIRTLVGQVGSEEKLVEYFGKPMRKIRREMLDGVRDGLLIDMLKQRKLAEVHIRRQDVVKFYEDNAAAIPEIPEKVTLSQILLEIKPSETAREQIFEKINAIRALAVAGADFDSLAKALSEGPSAPDGGRLGFTNRGDLVPDYEAAAYALEPEQISEVVETQFGLHIVKLVDRQGERISTQHILLQLAPSDIDKAQVFEKAQELRSKIIAGTSFAQVAKEYSEDPETAAKGGRLDALALDQLPPEFRTAVESIEIGEVSEPFESELGIHLVRLDDFSKGRSISLSKDWALLEMYALGQKRETVFAEWVEGLRADHYIWAGK